MQFNQLKIDIKDVGFVMLRTDTDDYLEAVITRDKLAEVILRLDRTFGLPVRPSKNKLPPQIQRTIEDFGGVREGQTLYFGQEDTYFVFAMLWPWQDGEHITLKIAKI